MSIQAKHTPGPWKIAEDGRTIEAADGRSVSGCVVSRMTGPDARLIAAAPELLDALRWLETAAGQADQDPRAVLLIASERARDAIAKAEGRSQ